MSWAWRKRYCPTAPASRPTPWTRNAVWPTSPSPGPSATSPSPSPPAAASSARSSTACPAASSTNCPRKTWNGKAPKTSPSNRNRPAATAPWPTSAASSAVNPDPAATTLPPPSWKRAGGEGAAAPTTLTTQPPSHPLSPRGRGPGRGGKQKSRPIRRLLHHCNTTQLRDRIHSASWAASSSLTAFGGIGIGPQLPVEPFLMLLAMCAASPAYLAATSYRAGPTTLLSTLWQATQALAENSASPGLPPAASPAASPAGAAATASAQGSPATQTVP